MSGPDQIRQRPGMYVGDTEDGSGIHHLVFEVIANAYDQYLAGRCTTIDVRVDADGTITVEDDGPGIPAGGGDGLPPLETLLGELSTTPTVDGHRPHVHMGMGGMGLFVVNALCERFELVSVHHGTEATIAYARGELVTPLVTAPAARASGTRIRFRPDPAIFLHARVPRAALARRLEELTFLAPRLTVTSTIAGDAVAAAGLAARVAIAVPCGIEDVAAHRGTFPTDRGPIEVEVALAWRTGPRRGGDPPVIDSFVNLERTRGDGSHVDGLIEGIRKFLGGGRREANSAGLVAAVSVVLADVQRGTPAGDRLDTPEARPAVAEMTRLALASWAERHVEAADAMRARRAPR